MLIMRDATAESITEPAKDERAQWAHHQRKSDGKGDLLDRFPEFLADRRKNKCEQEKIERVQCPAEEASDEGVPLNAIQRPY